METIGNKYSLIIANNRYKDKLLSGLSSSLKDIRELVKLFKDPNIGNFKNVDKLENCTSAKVNESIEYFFKGNKRNDILLFYFSGHGIEDDLGNLYLSTKNTRLNALRSTAIPLSFISELMDICDSRIQILVLDCVFTRILTKELHTENRSAIDFSHWLKGGGRIIITSSTCIQHIIYREGFKENKNISVFTHYMVKGLKTGKADKDGDGFISIDELYKYIYENVIKDNTTGSPKMWPFNNTDNVIIAKSVLGEIKTRESEETEQGNRENNKDNKNKPAYIITKKGWKNLIKGKEYTFFFLYIAIDNPAIIADKSPDLLEKEALCLQHYINRHIKGTKGKPWLNKKENYEQIVLFPYNGKNMAKVLRSAFHILLYKNLFDFEESCLEEPFSFKLALHLGNTQYYPNPANIPLVSKDINFIFHFAQQIEPEYIYVTEDIKKIMPSEFHYLFLPSGEFDTKDIYRINLKYNNECV